MINRGFLALPSAQSQRGLSSTGREAAAARSLPCLGVIISSLGEASLRCLVQEIHYPELARSVIKQSHLLLCHLEPGRGSWRQPGHSHVRAVPTG